MGQFKNWLEVHLQTPAKPNVVIKNLNNLLLSMGVKSLGFQLTAPYESEEAEGIGYEAKIEGDIDKAKFTGAVRSVLAKLGYQVHNVSLNGNIVSVFGSWYTLIAPNDLPRFAFHVTSKSNLGNIMKRGLLPGSGKQKYTNANPIHTANKIFLCFSDCEDWLNELDIDDPVMLRIDTRKIRTRKFYQDNSGWWQNYFIMGVKIPPDAIEVV